MAGVTIPIEIPNFNKANLLISETDPRAFHTQRVAEAAKLFFGKEVQLVAFGPGRVELNNHTDYSGPNAKTVSFALGGEGIGTYAAVCKPTNIEEVPTQKNIRIFSKQFHGEDNVPQITNIDINNPIPSDIKADGHWANYVRSIVNELKNRGFKIEACDIYVDSTIPTSGGLSSSAGLELSVINALCAANNIKIDPINAAILAQEAEHNPIIGSNCGLLDQATSALGAEDKGVLLTYDVEGLGGTTSNQFEFNSQPQNPEGKSFSNQKFVVVTCPEISRQLAGTKYNEMASDVKTSLDLLRNLGILNHYQGYGDLSPARLAEESSRILASLNSSYNSEIANRMFARITHEVEENTRAIEMITAAENGNVEDFAKAMVAGGESSVGLHRVGELTNGSTVFELPVFLAIMNTFADREQGVMAAKNCGGGGNMTSVLMVDANAVESLSDMLGSIEVDDDPAFMQSLFEKVTQNYRTEISPEVLREVVIKLMKLNREKKIVFTPTVPGPGAGIVYNSEKAI